MPRLLARKDTEGEDCFAGWLAMTESRLARNDGRKMARKDGKIIVIARSKASAERRGNLAKSLGAGGRDCHAYWLAMTDERWLAMTERLSSLRGARHQPSDEAISPLCHSDPICHSRENGNLDTISAKLPSLEVFSQP